MNDLGINDSTPGIGPSGIGESENFGSRGTKEKERNCHGNRQTKRDRPCIDRRTEGEGTCKYFR